MRRFLVATVLLGLVLGGCGDPNGVDAIDSGPDAVSGDIPVVTTPGVSIEDVSSVGCELVAQVVASSIAVAGEELGGFDPDELAAAFERVLNDEALGAAAISVGVDVNELANMRDGALAELRDRGEFTLLDGLMGVLEYDC